MATVKRKNICRKIAIFPKECVNCKRKILFEKYWLIYHGGYFYSCVCGQCGNDETEAIKKGTLVIKRPSAPGTPYHEKITKNVVSKEGAL